jgi:hypothetical protein
MALGIMAVRLSDQRGENRLLSSKSFNTEEPPPLKIAPTMRTTQTATIIEVIIFF